MASHSALSMRWPTGRVLREYTVLLDDRTASPGVKFKDAELLGMPLVVVVGRGWADGVVELRDRLAGEKRELAVGAELAGQIRAAVLGETG